MGRAVHVVDFNTHEGGAPYLKLDEDALREVLNQDAVKDLPVVVLSIAGRMRQGKSFLLNCLILYLENMTRGTELEEAGGFQWRETWLEGEHAPQQGPGGFQWRDGPVACTTGILVWSEVFVLKGPGGKRVAVLLMDTQGTFDTDTTMRECSTVFALSTMLSSVQIYNVMGDVKRDDLDSLQLFVEFGRAALNQQAAPLKKLEFLVRDWQWTKSHPLGATGGAEYIDWKLTNIEEVRSCFEQVSCFLLPYPWDLVDAQRQGLSDTFKSLLGDFFSNILAWDNLESGMKYIDGETIKTKDMETHFKAFVDIFRDNKLPPPKSAFHANVQIVLAKAYDIGMKTFEEARKVITGENLHEASPSQDPVAFEESLVQCQELAVAVFRERATLGDNTTTEHFLTQLKQDIETIILGLLELNAEKKRNERLREELERRGTLAETRLEEAERAGSKAAEHLEGLQKQIEEIRLAEGSGERDWMQGMLKMLLELMMQQARRDLEKEKEKEREARTMQEQVETERRRREREQGGSEFTAMDTFRTLLATVLSAAAPFIPAIISRMVGIPLPSRLAN